MQKCGYSRRWWSFIDSLSGFPGPFSSYVFKTIGNNGILKLVGDDRDAQFRAVIAYCDSNKKPILFESNVLGKISKNLQGNGWGYDPIFVPENQTKTYAELAEKNKLSHRYESLKKFANWFNNKQEWNDLQIVSCFVISLFLIFHFHP